MKRGRHTARPLERGKLLSGFVRRSRLGRNRSGLRAADLGPRPNRLHPEFDQLLAAIAVDLAHSGAQEVGQGLALPQRRLQPLGRLLLAGGQDRLLPLYEEA